MENYTPVQSKQQQGREAPIGAKQTFVVLGTS